MGQLLRPREKVEALVTPSCPTLCGPVSYGPPRSSVHGILQVRTLEWVAIPFFRRSSQPRDQTQASCVKVRLCHPSPQGSPSLIGVAVNTIYSVKITSIWQRVWLTLWKTEQNNAQSKTSSKQAQTFNKDFKAAFVNVLKIKEKKCQQWFNKLRTSKKK